ncbi:TonB-dependent receptor [Belliella aquatica]|uniref:TonB-dependent receptor n=1 Tax=Belliella aquatica TaxID=1323734 RepID=A0ABQ1LKM7_9BACT|nr:TonB-dependent receptor [Belliella aquatica]MCH7404064.1 TonB-dependent receptor [Belliella aquatica]GGC25072.1 TonB-dependent receptor [Belliella aquatica]
MKNLYVFGLLWLSIASSLWAQDLQVIVKDEHENTPLMGVAMLILENKQGAVSDENGLIIFSNPPIGKITLRFQLVGFESKQMTINWPDDAQNMPLEILLHESHDEMETVTISSTRSSRSIEDIPTRVEFIAGEELDEKVNMKPGDIRVLLSESTGIQVQVTSPTSANAGIRIQGLDGRYTQILKDGLPLYSGAASGLGLLQIPPLDLQQVELIKGSASTLYGGGAIAGLVNLISKRPTEEGELSFVLNGTNAGGLDASGFYGKRNDKIGTTIFAAYNTNAPFDPADIGLSAIPKFDRFTFNPKVFLYPTSRTDVEFGLNLSLEDRVGGNMEYLKGDRENQQAFFERNLSERISSQFVLNHEMGEGRKLQVKNSYNHFDRKLGTRNYDFNAVQQSTFTEVNYRLDREKTDWVIGGNLWTEAFKEEQTNSFPVRDYNLNTFGAFVQNNTNLSQKWVLESGLRTDYVLDYGLAVLPRIALMYKANLNFSSRFGGGLGYKAPTIFTEESERLQYQNIQPIDADFNTLEKSYGLNWDLNYKASLFNDQLFFSVNHLFFYTYLSNPLFLEQIGSSEFRFVNIDGYSDTKGTETNVKWTFRDFKWFMGYTYTHAKINSNGVVRDNPLTPKHRINSVLFYEVHDKWKIGWESYYFSQQRLSDGSVGQSYWIMGFMAEKIWEKFSVFINFENFLDARQTRFDTIFTGSIDNPSFREIYAPLDGFVINGGVKLRLK